MNATHSKSKKKVQDPADLGLNIGALRLQSHAEAGNMEGNPFSICFFQDLGCCNSGASTGEKELMPNYRSPCL